MTGSSDLAGRYPDWPELPDVAGSESDDAAINQAWGKMVIAPCTVGGQLVSPEILVQ